MKIKCTNNPFRQRKKLLKFIMRTFIFLLCSTAFGFTSSEIFSQNTKIRIDKDQVVSIDDVFDLLRNQTDYTFIYEENLFKDVPKVKLKKGSIRANRLLEICFLDKDFKIDLNGNKIVIIANDNTSVSPQTFTISGIVSDVDGQPLPGANIIEKNTTNGTQADFDGNFSIELKDENAVLKVSYIGFTTQEVKVNNQNHITIVLQEDSSQLDEVIIVSYGSQSSREITGAVENVKIEEILDQPVAQVGQMLQGKFAGLRVTQPSGRPGEGIRFQIRGSSSFTAGSDPLYVVDGLPLVGDISSINPAEISDVSVLKDAAASALYGSRASNGVVLIKTVSGTPGKSRISFNQYTGFQQIPENRKLKMMDAREYAKFQNEIASRNGRPLNPAFSNPEQLGKGTNWFDEITRSGYVQNYNINYSSATDKISTASVLNYFTNDGVVNETSFERASLRINTIFTPSDKIKIGLNVAPTYTHNTNFNTDGDPYSTAGNIVSSALITTPLASPFDENGDLVPNAQDPATFGNPNWVKVAEDITVDNENLILLSNAYLEYEIIKGLRFRTSANLQYEASRLFNFLPSTVGSLFRPAPQIPRGSENKSYFYNWALENTLSYEKTIGNNKFDLLGGFSSQRYKEWGTFVNATNFADDKIKEVGAASQTQVTSLVEEWTLASFFGRLNYNFKDKYLFSATFRGDGSSRFGPTNRWGYFPSASIGWVVTEEDFWNLEPISFFKIRASYGLTGNFNIGNFTFRNTLEPTFSVIGNNVVQGRASSNLGDNGLGWEKQKQLNIGGNLYFFNNRIQLNYDYYHKNVSDLLFRVNIPQSSGFNSLQTNIGEMKFWGHEFMVQSYNIQTPNFSWDTGFNVSIDRNEVLALDTANGVLLHGERNSGVFSHISRVGQPIYQFHGAIHDGVYVNQEDFDNSPKHASSQVGTVKFKDINGDGEITFPGDFTTIGNPWPDFTFGMTNSFKLKNFDLAVTINGSQGNEVLQRFQNWTTNLDGVFNVLEEVKDRWISPEQPGAGLYGSTQAGTTFLERDRFNTRMIKDASYLSFRNITFGYSIPLKKTSFISQFRVYSSVQNAFIITNYDGPNPEINTSRLNNGNVPGYDANGYPVPRTVSVGINLEF